MTLRLLFIPQFKFKQKTFMVLILFMVLFAIVLRYPQVGEYTTEIGTDSWEYHSIASDIKSMGNLYWVNDIWSLFGLSPPYQEAGTIVLFSSFDQISPIKIDLDIFIFSLFISIMSIFICWAFLNVLFKNDIISFFGCLSFVGLNIFVSATSWMIGPRGISELFIMALLFITILIMKFHEKGENSKKNILIILLIFLLIIFSTIHKILLPFPVLLIIAIGSYYLFKRVRWKTVISKPVYYLAVGLGIIIPIMSISNLLFIEFQYGQRTLYTQPDDLMALGTNFIINYGKFIGLLVIFIPIGYLLLLRTYRSNSGILFIIILIGSYLIFVNELRYSIHIFAPVIIVPIAYGIYAMIKSNRFFPTIRIEYKFVIMFLVIIILLIGPLYITIEKPQRLEGYSTSERYDVSFYMRNLLPEDRFISGDGVHINAIMALSEIVQFPPKDIENIENMELTLNLDLSEKLNLLSGDYVRERAIIRYNILYYDIDNSLTDEYIETYELKLCLVHNEHLATRYGYNSEIQDYTSKGVYLYIEGCIQEYYMVYRSSTYTLYQM